MTAAEMTDLKMLHDMKNKMEEVQAEIAILKDQLSKVKDQESDSSIRVDTPFSKIIKNLKFFDFVVGSSSGGEKEPINLKNDNEKDRSRAAVLFAMV